MVIEVGIIVALEEEFEELYNQLPSPEAKKDDKTGSYDYHFEIVSKNNISYRCATTFFGDMGPSKAAIACERFIDRCQPSTIVVLGIAGGLNDDVKLGDVVLVKNVNLYLERGKTVDGGETFEIQAGGDYYRCSDDLIQASSNLRFAHRDIYQNWQSNIKDYQENINQFNQLLDQDFIREQSKIVSGSIASGPVVGASSQFVNWLKRTNRNYLALEMESGGVLSSIYSHCDPKKTLILRGISDFGDERKKELDDIGKGSIRRYAMNNAIGLLWSLIEAGVLPKLTQLQGSIVSQDEDRSSVSDDDPKIKALKQDIEQLKKEYNSLTEQSRNSLSPVDRIRLDNLAETIYKDLESKQKELKEILN